MVGYAGSPTHTVYVDVTLTRSKDKVKVTGLLNFRQLAKPCMLAAMTAAPLRGFLVIIIIFIITPRQYMILHISLLHCFLRRNATSVFCSVTFLLVLHCGVGMALLCTINT